MAVMTPLAQSDKPPLPASEMERLDAQLRAQEQRLRPAASLAVIVLLSLAFWVPVIVWLV